MLSKLNSAATLGLSAILVEVEVDVAAQGLPSITIVGLASKAVDEARERVRSALKNSSSDFPMSRITINLAPADLPKEGPAYDLPIALGLLLSSGQIEADISKSFFFGELSLDGTLRHTKGALPLTLLAKEQGLKEVFLPADNALEASIVRGIDIYPVKNFQSLIAHLTGIRRIEPEPPTDFRSLTKQAITDFDFADIKGQEQAKRALEIAAAGGHNIFMSGTPGAGKTMMARAFPSILPSLSEAEAIEVTKIYSITGNIPAGDTIVRQRPFRAPHHTTSRIGLIGGGGKPMPGEISLAHRGVLFLDEFPEFPRHVLEAIRQPMEDGIVQISRAAGTMRYPAQFILVAAANPCPCGYYGSKKRVCKCLPGAIDRYQKKISGPILDRIDLHITVPEVAITKLAAPHRAEPSSAIQARVELARRLQQRRFKGTRFTCNAELTSRQLKTYAPLAPDTQKLLTQAASAMNLSARSYQKVIKIARTIADLAGVKEITSSHIAEALQYRPKISD